MFIAFEGIDSSGKATQSKLLYNHLSKNSNCILTQEPAYSSQIGALIKEILNDNKKFDAKTLQLLFTADRAYHLSSIIIPALNENKTVITDRYILSTIAYGAAEGLDEEWLKLINSKFPLPDIFFIIDVDPRITIKRKKQQKLKLNMKLDMNERRIKLLEDVRERYLHLQKEYKNALLIDGNRDVRQIHEEIVNIVKKYK